MTKTRSYFSTSKKSKIAIVAVEGKLTQALITSEYGVKHGSKPLCRRLMMFFLAPMKRINRHKNNLLTIYIKKLAVFKHNFHG